MMCEIGVDGENSISDGWPFVITWIFTAFSHFSKTRASQKGHRANGGLPDTYWRRLYCWSVPSLLVPVSPAPELVPLSVLVPLFRASSSFTFVRYGSLAGVAASSLGF